MRAISFVRLEVKLPGFDLQAFVGAASNSVVHVLNNVKHPRSRLRRIGYIAACNVYQAGAKWV